MKKKWTKDGSMNENESCLFITNFLATCVPVVNQKKKKKQEGRRATTFNQVSDQITENQGCQNISTKLALNYNSINNV